MEYGMYSNLMVGCTCDKIATVSQFANMPELHLLLFKV